MPAYVTPHADLMKIARDNLNSALELEKRIAALRQKQATLAGDEAEAFDALEIGPVENKFGAHCTIAVVFSALAVESYIYLYAIQHLSENFVDSHLDKLDVLSKWVVIPRLILTVA